MSTDVRTSRLEKCEKCIKRLRSKTNYQLETSNEVSCLSNENSKYQNYLNLVNKQA